MKNDSLEKKSEWTITRALVKKKDKTERAKGLGRKTREETGKGNQMTALRFQTGE